MDFPNKLKEAFLIFDRNGSGKLDKGLVIVALQSMGFVLNNDTQAKISPMTLTEFVKYGQELAKVKTPETCTQEIVNHLTANKKTLRVKDLEHVVSAISCISETDFKKFLATVNPNGADTINPANLIAQLTR